jgi:arylsulfatase A-like enzyme
MVQMAVVLAVLAAGKLWLVWRVAEVTATSPRLLAALPQDVMVACILGILLAVTALPGWPVLRVLGEIAVAAALLANCVLIFIAREVQGLFTADADKPRTLGALVSVLDDYGSVPRYVTVLAIAGALWVAPALAGRFGIRPRRWAPGLGAVLLPLILAASVSGTAAPAHQRDDVFEVGSLRDSPIIHYLGGAFGHRGFADVGAPSPASFDDMSRALAPVAGAAGARESAAGLEELADRPFNVVLVVLESVGMTAFDFDAPASERHPFLSRIREHAVRFLRYSSPAPHSQTALASIFCSQLRLPVGVDNPRTRAREHCRPLPSVLERAGVRTGFFQSTYVGDWIDGPFFDRLQFGVSKDASLVLKERRASGRPVAARSGILQEHETVSELLGWIDERCTRREPFFGVYYSWVAHAPYPPEHAGRFGFGETLPPRERHHRLVRTLDEQIERIHDAVVARDGCGRPTVLLVIGDHGEAFEEHPGNRYHVMHVYEENVRVPLLVIAPDLAARQVDRVASHIDLAPTILDLTLGHEALATTVAPEGPGFPGRPYQGRSLLRSGAPWPVFSVSLQGEGRASIRFAQFKLISSPRTSWLFDTDADPGEHRDLTLRHPDLARALRGAFGGWVTYQLAYQGRL